MAKYTSDAWAEAGGAPANSGQVRTQPAQRLTGAGNRESVDVGWTAFRRNVGRDSAMIEVRAGH